MGEVLSSLESSGGYAILAGMVLIGLFWLSRTTIDGATQRNKEREVEALRRFDAQMARERSDRDHIAEMTNRMITALDGNTKVIATVIEITRETNNRLETIDRHLSKENESGRKQARMGA